MAKKKRWNFTRDLMRVPRPVWYMTIGTLASAPLALIRPEFLLMGASIAVMLGVLWDFYRTK